ncbi:unnamed protein product [Brachionus calyciflorus]|uniref:Integrase zinc-binding domain-containing protein n=1 Tax=Brachionus calyciflorus TaxID=104777 RepID=A0A814RYG4_9BILA|nr:unnamed protein product [Brachionus calyciflorus]
MKNPNARLTRWSILLQTFDFEIIHPKGVLHSNVDALSRPVMIADITDNNDEDLSTKYLEPYQDSHILHFLKYNRHPEGSSKKQVKRVSRLSKHFTLKEDTLYFRKLLNESFKVLVPKIEDRIDILANSHNLGHFKTDTVYTNLSKEFYWKAMKDEIEKFIKKCNFCIRFDKSKVIEHPALTLPIRSIFDRIGIDLVFGLPKTVDG